MDGRQAVNVNASYARKLDDLTWVILRDGFPAIVRRNTRPPLDGMRCEACVADACDHIELVRIEIQKEES